MRFNRQGLPVFDDLKAPRETQVCPTCRGTTRETFNLGLDAAGDPIRRVVRCEGCHGTGKIPKPTPGEIAKWVDDCEGSLARREQDHVGSIRPPRTP